MSCTPAAHNGWGHWQSKQTTAVASATGERRILYYRCPMHPTYRSDHPGTAPCCGMAYEPVYANDDAASERSSTANPPGTVLISPEQQHLIGITYETVAYGPVHRTMRAPA